jgi:hypothetical protein
VARHREEEVLRAGRSIGAMLAITTFATVALVLLAAAVVIALRDRAGINSPLVLGP